MKISHLLLAAGLCGFGTAAAQTTPAPTTPGTTTASPSGTAPVQANPNGAVSPSEVFTTGAPTNTSASDKRMKRKEMKADGKAKMKTKM